MSGEKTGDKRTIIEIVMCTIWLTIKPEYSCDLYICRPSDRPDFESKWQRVENNKILQLSAAQGDCVYTKAKSELALTYSKSSSAISMIMLFGVAESYQWQKVDAAGAGKLVVPPNQLNYRLWIDPKRRFFMF